MQTLKPLEAGVVFWGERDSVAQTRGLGVRCGQLIIPGTMPLSWKAAQKWQADLESEDFTVTTVFAAYEGEDYADIPTVKRTVGFIPPETRTAREVRTREVGEFAAAIGVNAIACHIGMVPHDTADADYIGVRDLVRRICDFAAEREQTFAMETGQEPADVLLRFFEEVDRPNLRINFDPANMILYGSGEPIEALRKLSKHVVSVHCKDGDWPPAGVAGALGTERPLGKGAVGIEKFVATLKELGFQGTLNVERETDNQEERLRDIAAAVAWLKQLTA
jgi:sugar phosphate isomerase/epimerase